MILIGKMCDRSDSRVISKERGQSLADEYGIKFMETSAKENINVEKVAILSIVSLSKDLQCKYIMNFKQLSLFIYNYQAYVHTYVYVNSVVNLFP